MPDTIESLIADMLRIRDDAITRTFATDIYTYAPASRLLMARTYYGAVRDYESRRAELNGSYHTPAGAILGTRKPPKTAHHVLTPSGHALEAGGKKSATADATHWCDSAAGWWRVPLGEKE